MKILLKIVICLTVFGINMFLIKIGQYNFISFITGMIWMALWLGICEYLDD